MSGGTNHICKHIVWQLTPSPDEFHLRILMRKDDSIALVLPFAHRRHAVQSHSFRSTSLPTDAERFWKLSLINSFSVKPIGADLNRPVRDRPFVLGYKRRRYYYRVTRTVYDNNVDPRRCNKTSTDDKVMGTEQADQANAEESVTKLRLTPLSPPYDEAEIDSIDSVICAYSRFMQMGEIDRTKADGRCCWGYQCTCRISRLCTTIFT
jgi:hypothetical protein